MDDVIDNVVVVVVVVVLPATAGSSITPSSLSFAHTAQKKKSAIIGYARMV